MQLGGRKCERAKTVAPPSAPQCVPPVASSDLTAPSAVGDDRGASLDSSQSSFQPSGNHADFLTSLETCPVSGHHFLPALPPVSSSPILLIDCPLLIAFPAWLLSPLQCVLTLTTRGSSVLLKPKLAHFVPPLLIPKSNPFSLRLRGRIRAGDADQLVECLPSVEVLINT